MVDNTSDDDFFKNMMRGVVPLGPQKSIPLIKKKPPPPRKKCIVSMPSDPCGLYNTAEHTQSADSILNYGQKKISSTQWAALKQGAIHVELCVDLHGLTMDEARDKLWLSMSQARKHQVRMLLIIHGKGGYDGGPSRLKSQVDHWLKQLPDVLAYHSATPKHGGTGAVYVLLRKINLINKT